MNLTKYFMISCRWTTRFGPTDMPSIWNLQKYKPEKGHPMNLAGDSHDAFGHHRFGARPARRRPAQQGGISRPHEVAARVSRAKPPPKYPFPIDQQKAAAGKRCSTGTARAATRATAPARRVPVAEVGTDRNRLETWNKEAAIAANKVVREMGIERKGLVEETLNGYIAAFLDGIWLRAPYLHNGSVPTLRDLLEPVEKRPQEFLSRLRRLRSGKGRLRHE